MTNIRFAPCSQSDGQLLADVRAIAMKPSLEALGRYDEHRVRHRFLENFIPDNTTRMFIENALVGFYVLIRKSGHHYLDHLYILPDFQNLNIGSVVINRVKHQAINDKIPVRLGALRGSKANEFYRKHGFIKTHEEAFDIYYEFKSN